VPSRSEFDQDGEKKGIADVSFSARDVAPFSVTKHTVFGVNNNPQVKFSSVEKTVEVSHWGNVGITENYQIVNTGPALKGEFSRVTYGSRNQGDARNAFKGIEFDLPYEIWGLYYQDEVGNISTSKAYRDDSNHLVHVALQPRFALLGGWKSNWQMGYNFKTDGHLFHEGSKFELRNLKLEYALEKIVAEDFRIKLVLPHGAENVKIRIGGHDYDMSLVEKTTTEGYLDFSGRPTFVIDSFTGSPKDKFLDVSYDYSPNSTFEKPISLFLIVLGCLLFAVFIKRFKLEAFENSKSE
jgi:oligosaccharyltransferase complex subunit alpha (ribophorin I)